MFEFKCFSVRQDRTAMKVGTDGVLLGAWANIKSNDHEVLDIGTGTGIISLMIAQRNSQVHIDAVDIDVSSAEQALENFKESRWSDRLDVHNLAIQDFNKEKKYDLIVSNPPFFSNSLLSPKKERTNARHTTTLNFKDLVDSVVLRIAPQGRFVLILPTIEAQRFNIEAGGKLHLNRKCEISSIKGGDVKRVMSEYSLSPSDRIEVERIVIREVSGKEYTQEYMSLTEDFYLKF